MQTVRNRVADILGIDLPIVQAPMNYIAGHALAAAVSAAGGMGVLGPNAGKVQGEEISMRERTLREFARIREVTDKPVGINVVVPDGENKAALMYARSTVEAAAEGGATAAFCVGGLQPTIFELIKEKGMKLIVRPLTPTVKNAREAQAMGADIFVATGYDAGGFLPSHHTGTFSIVPTIVDAVTIPVLCCWRHQRSSGCASSLCSRRRGCLCRHAFYRYQRMRRQRSRQGIDLQIEWLQFALR